MQLWLTIQLLYAVTQPLADGDPETIITGGPDIAMSVIVGKVTVPPPLAVHEDKVLVQVEQSEKTL